MKSVVLKLNNIVDEYFIKLNNIDNSVLSLKENTEKWSKKEILGHLIDSALNNTQRFVRTQHEANPHIVYNQNEWVEILHYQEYDSKELIQLWKYLNKHIIFILDKMPVNKYEFQCNTGKEKETLHSLQFLANDYVEHLLHHLKQITGL